MTPELAPRPVARYPAWSDHARKPPAQTPGRSITPATDSSHLVRRSSSTRPATSTHQKSAASPSRNSTSPLSKRTSSPAAIRSPSCSSLSPSNKKTPRRSSMSISRSCPAPGSCPHHVSASRAVACWTAQPSPAAAPPTQPPCAPSPLVRSRLRAGLPARVIDVYGRQVPYLVPGEVEPDPVVGSRHGADRDGYLLAAPQVPFLQEHMGHMAVAGVDDQPFHVPDCAVGGMDTVAAAHRHLAKRDGVEGDGLRDPGDRVARHRRGPGQARVRPGKHLFRAVGLVAPGPRHELRLLGGIEVLELGKGAAEPDLAVGGVDKVEGHKPAEPLAARRLDHEMGDRAGNRVDHHAGYLTAGSVGAAGGGPDQQRGCPLHIPPFSPASTLVLTTRSALGHAAARARRAGRRSGSTSGPRWGCRRRGGAGCPPGRCAWSPTAPAAGARRRVRCPRRSAGRRPGAAAESRAGPPAARRARAV